MSLSIGKLNGLRRLANNQGIFCITAMDQRGSLKVLVDPADPNKVTAKQLVDIKLDLAAALSPYSTAILIDPQFGAPQAISAGALDPHVGLILTLESEHPKKAGQGIVSQIPDGWSVEKLKRMGGDAVKLLVRYRPDLDEAAADNRRLVRDVAEQCTRWDIPFVLEAVTYPLDGQSREDFARQKPHLVITSAKELSNLGCDIYKAEFPADPAFETDSTVLRQLCQELNQASAVPWVLLSAGVDIERFARVLEIASQCGASGFLAGRAIWKDYVTISDPSSRLAALQTKAVHNLGLVTHLARRDALPWTKHRGVHIPTPNDFPPDWYVTY